MVGAVTGTDEQTACEAIWMAAAEDKEHPSDLVDCRFRHQCRAIELLGYELLGPNGVPIQASDMPNEIQIPPYAPTIEEFVRDNKREGVFACLAGGTPPGKDHPQAHSFAVEGQSYFDNNVGDELVTVEGVPQQLRNYRVAKYLRVRCRASSDEATHNKSSGEFGAPKNARESLN
jgi:hypothetical protein